MDFLTKWARTENFLFGHPEVTREQLATFLGPVELIEKQAPEAGVGRQKEFVHPAMGCACESGYIGSTTLRRDVAHAKQTMFVRIRLDWSGYVCSCKPPNIFSVRF